MNTSFTPDYAVPPGETLLETIEALGLSQADLAQRMGRPPKTINEIIKGKAAITADTALQLEHVLQIPASFWNNAEQNYREALARIAEAKRLEEHEEWLRRFSVDHMAKWGWIKKHGNLVDQWRELLVFFGVASPHAWKSCWGDDFTARLQVDFRKSNSFEGSWPALAAWLRQGEIEAQKQLCESFKPELFRACLKEVRHLTTKSPEEFVPKMVEMCASSGVALVFVPPLPKTYVSGATRWVQSKPIVQLSLRGKFNDLLWFTFFHEAGHILLHGKSDVFIEDGKLIDVKEREANEFSADLLIPKSEWIRFRQKKGRPTRADVLQFSEQIEVAPGIVVGRLQHEGILPRSHLNDLKVRFEFVQKAAD